MRAVRFHAAGDIRVEEVREPEAKDGEAIVDIHWGGICGTDLHEYTLGPLVIPPAAKRGPHPLTGEVLPVILGHEFCGRITGPVPGNLKSATGEVLKEGMPVIVDPRQNCRSCSSCNAHATHLCGQWDFLGLTGGGGGFAERCAVKADMLYPLPESVRLEDAALIEPLAVSKHALTQSGIRDWKALSVLVIGGGPVGLAVLFNLRAAGASDVFLSEPTERRRTQCQELAQHVFNPTEVSVPHECRKLTKDEGVDIVFDCAGITLGMRDGMDALRRRGIYVNVVGWEKAFVLPMEFFMMKELVLKTSMAYDDMDFAATVRDYVEGKFAGAEKMVTARIGLEDVKEGGFEQLVRNRDGHVKILVTSKSDLLRTG